MTDDDDDDDDEDDDQDDDDDDDGDDDDDDDDDDDGDCNQLWASRAFSQRELQIQFSSVRIRTPRTTRSTTQ